MSLKLIVDGMHCKSCKMLIEEELEDLGAENIEISLNEDNSGVVVCDYDDEEGAVKAIETLGDYVVRRG